MISWLTCLVVGHRAVSAMVRLSSGRVATRQICARCGHAL